MDFENYFPIWKSLTKEEQLRLKNSAVLHQVHTADVVHDAAQECTGLLLVVSGQLRAFIISDAGKEITLYRLLERDLCLFSASCIIRSIQFDITVTAEKDTAFYLIPTDVYKSLMERSITISAYTNEVMASRMSDVMWLMEQVMWKSFDKRLAAFLIEEQLLNNSPVLTITHEQIANHLGSAREVVTRMLRYLQSENLLTLSRGTITITDPDALDALAQTP